MKLSGYLETYYDVSGKASDVARSASLGGIGLVWVFRVDAKPAAALPKELLWPTAMFAAALALDLLQYTVSTITWGIFHRYHERKLTNPGEDPEVVHSPWLKAPIELCFLLKLAAVAAGYWGVGRYILGVWWK